MSWSRAGAVLVGDEVAARALERRLGRIHALARSTVQFAGGPCELLRPASAEALISEEDFAVDERLPYWADLWPSATVLAREVGRERGGGRSFLELGCGLGLVAAAAAHAGFEVTATDYYDDALPFASLNAWRLAGRPIHTRHVDWRALPADLGTFDVVAASDVLYERVYAPLVAAVFARALAPQGTGWLADPGRIALGAFTEECASRGLTVERSAGVRFEEGDQRQLITLHRIHRISRR